MYIIDIICEKITLSPKIFLFFKVEEFFIKI